MLMLSPTPPVAVIILNWNGERLLRRFLPSVVENTPPELAHIIVADNGSTDGSLNLLARDFPEVKVIRFAENHGFAKGYNLALEQTRYPYTVLLNSDVSVPAGWLAPLYTAMERDHSIGACQPKILSADHPDRFEYAGAAGGFIDRNGYPYCRGRLFATVEKDLGQYDTPADLFWASGAALMVRTELYLRLGGLDPAFFAHMEEIDLCWRILLDGHRIVCVPGSAVYHLGGGSLPAENPKKTYLNFRNNLLMLHKNLPLRSLRSTLLRRRLLDTAAWLRFMLAFDFRNANAVIRAHNDFRRMRRAYTSHPSVNLLTHTADGTPRSLPNLLSSYYMRGRRHYSDLL